MIQENSEDDEIMEYVERFRNVPPEEVLRMMGEMRDFFIKNMTDEGRVYFEADLRERYDPDSEEFKAAVRHQQS